MQSTTHTYSKQKVKHLEVKLNSVDASFSNSLMLHQVKAKKITTGRN